MLATQEQALPPKRDFTRDLGYLLKPVTAGAGNTRRKGARCGCRTFELPGNGRASSEPPRRHSEKCQIVKTIYKMAPDEHHRVTGRSSPAKSL